MIELVTERLRLVAADGSLVRAEIEDREHFARLLGAVEPQEWPPPLNDADSMRYYLEMFEHDPALEGWGPWYFLLRPDADGLSHPIGNGGFKGRPDAQGRVEVGYSVLERHQRRGYAPEAVRALVAWAFDHPEVTWVEAHTLPDLRPSIRVLETCGFELIGEGEEAGTILYRLHRP